MIVPKIKLISKKLTKDSHKLLYSFEKALKNSDSKKIPQVDLDSFYALESMIIFNRDLIDEKRKR